MHTHRMVKTTRCLKKVNHLFDNILANVDGFLSECYYITFDLWHEPSSVTLIKKKMQSSSNMGNWTSKY